MIEHSREHDLRDLNILHMVENEGRTLNEAARLNGVSRSTAYGLRRRVRLACDKHPCACEKPENMDGGMPPLWWDV